MKQIEGVARAGEVQIEARILRIQPVISEIVDPAEAKRGAELISFCRMIVNHIENHFDSGSVKAAHHRLELGNLLAQLPATGVLRMRREKSDRVVAPVIRQTAIDQAFVVNMRMHGQQFDRGHAKFFQIINSRRAAERRIGATQLLRHSLPQFGETFDVRLINH